MRRTTCAANLAMSSQRPRASLYPNPVPFFLPPSGPQPHFPYQWRRPFCESPIPIFESRPATSTHQYQSPHPVYYQSHFGSPCAPPYPPSYAPMTPVASVGPYRPPFPGGGYARPQGFRPSPRPRPPDYRIWIPTRSSPPPRHCERFKVLSYNILADYLARDHRSLLYPHIPVHILDWEWRKKRLLFEFGLWSADIMCLQEVDKFLDMQEELAQRGYDGLWKMRTGVATDGCATFWRTNRFRLRHEEHIEFNKLGLRDNVAQICVLESICQQPVESNSLVASTSLVESQGTNQVVVCNIHVLYNPKRGDVKLGQVRVLVDQALTVSKHWNNAPVIICGDFNSTPKSALYKFLSEQKLDLSEVLRDQVSGQYSCVLTPAKCVDKFQGVHLPQGLEDTKVNAVDGAHVVFQNEHKASDAEASLRGPSEKVRCGNILEKNLDIPNSVEQFAHDVSQLSLSNTERKMTKDSSIEAATKDCGLQDLRNQNQNFSHTVVIEASAAEVVRSRRSFASSVESVSIINKAKLKLDIEDQSSTHVEMEECLNSDSGVSTQKNLGLALGQEHALHGNDANTCKTNKTVLNNNQDMSTSDKKMDTDKEDGNGPVHSDVLQDTGDNLNKCPDFPSEELPNFEQEQEGWHSNSFSFFHMDNSLDGYTCESCKEELSDHSFLVELHGKKSMDELSEEETFVSENNPPTQFDPKQGIWSPMYDQPRWSPAEIETATGSAECFILQHSLKLRSAYAEAKDFPGSMDSNGEPHVTSYNRKFMGTVDYIWFSNGLQTIKVLGTIPKVVLQQTKGFPTPKWGSDHIALACEFAFSCTPAEHI